MEEDLHSFSLSEGNSSYGFTPDSYTVTDTDENLNHPERSTMPEPVPVRTPSAFGAPWETDVKKKKRGKPRLNGQDEKVITLSPMPISASVPLAGDYSSAAGWRRKDRSIIDSVKKKQKNGFGNGGLGAHFTPHILTVNAGEDVSKTIISFSQQGEASRAICILAANGLISNVTLIQPNSSGGTLTYEGQFEILSLNGSFKPMDDGVTKNRSGGMSISFSAPNGQILGGGLAGLLVAAGPVQVVIGSFSPDHRLDQQMKQNNHSDENGTDEFYY